MEFVKLGDAYTSDYVPTELIEGYNSLIWTERYQTLGEFELKSFDVDGLTAKLPEDTLVSHLETKEVMRVDTHEINMVGEGADARPEITIRGRSAYSILEDRYVESDYQKKREMRKKYSSTSALCVLLYQAVDNNSGKDVTRGESDSAFNGAPQQNDYPWNTADDIPNVCVTEAVPSEGVAEWWQLSEGVLWPQFENLLLEDDLGIRTIRPTSPNPGKVITVATALSTRGNITRTDNADISMLRFEVYKGTDRSDTVQFSLLQGHVDNPTYLSSHRSHKSVIEIMSKEVAVKDVYRDGEAGFTGWRRRADVIDGGAPSIPDAPEKPDDLGRNPTQNEREQYHNQLDAWRVKMGQWRTRRDTKIANFRAAATRAAKRKLKEMSRVDMFAGDVTNLTPYRYKTHYDLGDTVQLFGDYGKSAKFVVSEYVRTEDANGDRGFPGLVAP